MGEFVSCDQCNAPALYIVELKAGGTLTFCGHHQRANKPALEAGGAFIFELEG